MKAAPGAYGKRGGRATGRKVSYFLFPGTDTAGHLCPNCDGAPTRCTLCAQAHIRMRGLIDEVALRPLPHERSRGGASRAQRRSLISGAMAA